jgi:hypothetical protein
LGAIERKDIVIVFLLDEFAFAPFEVLKLFNLLEGE